MQVVNLSFVPEEATRVSEALELRALGPGATVRAVVLVHVFTGGVSFVASTSGQVELTSTRTCAQSLCRRWGSTAGRRGQKECLGTFQVTPSPSVEVC